MKSKDFGRPGYKSIFYIEDNGKIFTVYCKRFFKLPAYGFSAMFPWCCLQIYLFIKYRNLPVRAKRHDQSVSLMHDRIRGKVAL
jgi:hypothetical protein